MDSPDPTTAAPLPNGATADSPIAVTASDSPRPDPASDLTNPDADAANLTNPDAPASNLTNPDADASNLTNPDAVAAADSPRADAAVDLANDEVELADSPRGIAAAVGGESNASDAAIGEDAGGIENGEAAGIENGSESVKGGALGGVGSRTFTMRELLNELKEGEAAGGEIEDVEDSGDGADRASSFSQNSSLQHQNMGQSDVAMDLINNVTGVDEEGRSRQRILSFAAKRYASAIERNSQDYDAYYNWALVLQESADNVGPDSSSPSKDALLEEACKKYDEATQLCPTLHDAYYNWAIAISDRAKLHGRTKEAEELWKQAAKNYEKAVQLNWNSPQALNNWGLALQELSAIVPAREKQTIVRTAISKFRAAIQLQFDFHRAIYNLGTVLYGLAEDTLRSGRAVNSKELSPNELYSLSAIYIAAAYSLKPNYSVYRSALRLVRSMLPLPYLKVGYLTAPPSKNPIAPHTDWERCQFVLNHEGLQQVTKADKQLSPSPSGRFQQPTNVDKSLIKVDIPDIISVSACADLTLPAGAGLCIETIHGAVYLVADTWESLDGWLDAIRLVYTIFARGRTDVLAGIITG